MARVIAIGLAVAAFAIAPASAQDTQGKSVPSYHGDNSRRGNFVVPELTWDRARSLHMDESFRAQAHGNVYAQPLYWHDAHSDSRVLIVVTENDVIDAIDARSGRPIWTRALGKPVPRSSLPCGNISPLGITGTPVIDPSREAVYLDAVIDSATGPRHLVFGLSLKDGATLPGWPLDVAEALRKQGQSFVARDQNQRGALAILNGALYVPFGGHFGDCGNYHGVVLRISLSEPHGVRSWTTRARGGGIWAPGGISHDGESLFVTTGNTMGATSWSDGEAVIRLSPDLRRSDNPRDFFAPSDWRTLDSRDADLGGTNALPLQMPDTAGGQSLILALGKDRKAYLLDRSHLGGIGSALATETVASRALITSPIAYPDEDGMFVAFHGQGTQCPTRQDGLITLKIRSGSPPGISTAWCASVNGAGAPIATTTDGRSNPIVWMLGAEGDNRLHAFRGDTGQPLATSQPLTGLRHFQTLIAAEGRLYVSADGKLYAFSF